MIALSTAYFWVVMSVSFCNGSYIGKNDEVLSLDELFAYLRHDDERLVRYNVPSEEAESRQQNVCSAELLDRLVGLLDASAAEPTTLEDKMKVIKITTLCSSENPQIRKMIGTLKEGIVLETIVSMLDRGDEAVAVCGEAIWILSFNDAHNRDYFVEKGAIPKMVNTIIKSGNIHGHFETLAIMWTAAALQNLAASYCKTQSGHCWWENDFHYGLHLHRDSPLSIDGSNAARKIVQSEDFVRKLKDLACRGPIESDQIWPSLATIGDSFASPKLSTWAVAGLLKNLSLYTVSRPSAYSAKQCLCILQESEDWLESSKAQDALYRLGVDEEECWQSVEREL